MSYYEDERQRMRPTRERYTRDSYEDDSLYSRREGGGYNKTTALVKRRDSYDDVEEDIQRDFPPPSGRGGYVRETTIRKSGVRPARARSFDEDRFLDDRYDDGAFVARRSDRRRDDRRDYDSRRRGDSDYSSRSRSRTPPRRERRKSRVEEALEAAGLGGLVGGILGKDKKDDRYRSKSRSGRDRASSETRSDRRSRSRKNITQAITAAVVAGAGEAFRTRKDPGGLSGDKGRRILTAAAAAGGVDALLKSGKNPEHHKYLDTIGSAVAGLATSKIVNGPRSKSRGRGGSPDSRRGRSQSRGGFGELLAGGTVAATAKKIYDNVRESRSRGRSESRSRYSDLSSSPPRSKSRRRSVSRAAARGLAAVGLGSAAAKLDPGRDRDRSRSRDTSRSRSRRGYSDVYDDRSRSGYYDDDYRDDVGQPRSDEVNGRARSLSQYRPDWEDGRPRSNSQHGYSLDFGPRHNGDPDTDSDSDLGCSSDEEEEKKKGKRKWLVTTGLATVATIHAGHSVYQSYEKHQSRKLAVTEGRVSAEKAKESQNRDRLQEAASVGIAALGLKGAYSEWKEMKEHREEYSKEIEKAKRHHQKRENRRKKAQEMERLGYTDSGYASSMPNLHSPPPMHPPPGGWHQPFDDNGTNYNGQGPYSVGGSRTNVPAYYDDNPYGGSFAHPTGQTGGSPLPPPPVGSDHRAQGRNHY